MMAQQQQQLHVKVDERTGRFKALVDAQTGKPVPHTIVPEARGLAAPPLSASVSEESPRLPEPVRAAAAPLKHVCAWCGTERAQEPSAEQRAAWGACVACNAVAFCRPTCHAAHYETIHYKECPRSSMYALYLQKQQQHA
jgi:hypothetical protein